MDERHDGGLVGDEDSFPIRESQLDNGARAREIADRFARQFPGSLPPPGTELAPTPGRHVRLSAETPGAVYVGGQTYYRDAGARISARATGIPPGWALRFALVKGNGAGKCFLA